MIRTVRLLLLPAALVALLLIVPAHAAASPLAVLRDCADSDFFEKRHSVADLKRARDQIQADLGEYGTCGRMIQRELAKRRAEKGPKATGSSVVPVDLDGDGQISDRERRIAELNAQTGGRSGTGRGGSDGRTQVAQVPGVDIDPGDDDDDSSSGTVATSGGGGGSSLALILAVAALACGAVGGGLWYAGKRNPAVGNALRRVPIPFRNS